MGCKHGAVEENPGDVFRAKRQKAKTATQIRCSSGEVVNNKYRQAVAFKARMQISVRLEILFHAHRNCIGCHRNKKFGRK